CAASLLAQAPPQARDPGQTQGGGEGRGQGGAGRRGGGPSRDVLAQQGSGVISGKVVAADTGRPLKHARVVVSGTAGSHAVSTDEQGRYRIASLGVGSYNVTAAKSGYVDGAFGQRRSL